MSSLEYANAYSEVLEILNFIPREDYNKLPESKLKMFERNANPTHHFSYNPKQTLEEQNVSEEARAIISILFRDYWATQVQKEKIIAKQNYDRQLIEQKKREKYNPDNIFKKPESLPNTGMQLINIEKEGFFQKIINFVKSIFNLNN